MMAAPARKDATPPPKPAARNPTPSSQAPKGAGKAEKILGTAVVSLAAVAGTAGLLSLFGWFVPHFTEGILPSWFVEFFQSQFEQGKTAAFRIHIVGGIALGIAAGFWAYRAWRRQEPWLLVPHGHETATSAFWRWVVGRFTDGRLRRLHFRDALIFPAGEFAISLAIAAVSFVLAIIPWGPPHEAGLAIHRINGLYMAFLGGYSLFVVAFRRRGDSPFATVIRDGKLVKRPVQYGNDA